MELANVTDYFHLSGASLAPGSIILPGNFGRMIRSIGWPHGQALREMALEDARLARFPHRPSRLQCAFAFVTVQEARNFRVNINGFQYHVLYRVSLSQPQSEAFVTESRLCGPCGDLRVDWPDAYWAGDGAQATLIPGITWPQIVGTMRLREMLTLSGLVVEERLD